MPTVADKRREFRRLHESGCFVLPNPWDIGTTRYLQSLGFKALATTSAGYAFARALPDGGVKRDDMIAHIAELSAAADVPCNADFEGGYADAPEGVAESVRCAAAPAFRACRLRTPPMIRPSRSTISIWRWRA